MRKTLSSSLGFRSALEVREDFFDDDGTDLFDDDDDNDEVTRHLGAVSSTASSSSSVAIRRDWCSPVPKSSKTGNVRMALLLKRRCRTSKPDFLSKDGDPIDEDDDTDIWTTENLATGPFQAHFTRERFPA